MKNRKSINVNKNIANVMYASEKRAEEEQEIFLEQGKIKKFHRPPDGATEQQSIFEFLKLQNS